jgi:phage tail-like protein
VSEGVDPFRIEPGSRSGRIEPGGAPPAEGDFVWCFGSDVAGFTATLADGDEVSVSQTGEHSPAELIRHHVRTRGPSAMPAGWTWYFVARVDAVEVWRVEIDPDRSRVLTDLAIDAVGLPATITLEYALLVEGTPGTVEEIEIPAVYLDQLILDDAAPDLSVVNRDPQSGEARVPRDGDVAFDLADTTGSAPDASATQIFVDGVLAYDGSAGGAQPGFSVAESTPVSGQRRFVVDVLPMPFESEAVVVVRVVSANLAATASVDDTWVFTAADETPPRILSAFARELRRVRATFDEPVLQADPAGAGDALNPASWRLDPIQPDDVTPAIPVGVSSVKTVSDFEVDLILDDDPSFVDYDLVALDVLDAEGNAVDAPLDRARFAAFVPPQPARRDWNLYRWLPEFNRDEDMSGTRDLLRFTNALQEVIDLQLYDVDRWVEIFDVDGAEERYLDAILVGLGNPFPWVEELSETDKRRLIRVLVDMYKQKGTIPGIQNVVRFFLGIEVTIDEYSAAGWILGVDLLGDTVVLGTDVSVLRYTFDVISASILDADERRRIAQIVDLMKPAHTHHARTIDPDTGVAPDHLELGVSLLFEGEWILH